MALTCCCCCTLSPQFVVRKQAPPDSYNSGIAVKRVASSLRSYKKIRSSYKTKVFEDRAEGIICYEDENGQIICEGYDEGPRFHPIITTYHHPRDVEIMKMLHTQWLQMTAGKLNNTDDNKTVAAALQDDFNWKWL